MKYLLFYAIVLIILFLSFYIEAKRHEHNLNKLALRIHVNGTRGKSSVTRLIAAGLRSGGYRVFAKTTGTEAKLIFPDGSEQYVQRRGLPNIRENIKVVKQAVNSDAEVLVIECMAVSPELQYFCEHRLIKSHIGVITNVRADHEDVMGKDINSVAISLSNTIPRQGQIVTSASGVGLLKEINKDARFIVADEIDASYLKEFPYEVIGDNVSIALKVCELAGVDMDLAISGMLKANPDPGNLKISYFEISGKKIKIINALAANDPESTLWLWKNYVREDENIAVFLNCRKDRQWRTLELCKALARVNRGYFIVTGDKAFTRTSLAKCGLSDDRVYLLPELSCFNEFLNMLSGLGENDITVFAAGNIKGLSQEFLMNLNGGNQCMFSCSPELPFRC